jgi:hypothetical protein
LFLIHYQPKAQKLALKARISQSANEAQSVMSGPSPSKSAAVFANFLNLVLALTQIGILVVLALILKELKKIITGDNTINVNTDSYYGKSSYPWYVRVVQ